MYRPTVRRPLGNGGVAPPRAVRIFNGGAQAPQPHPLGNGGARAPAMQHPHPHGIFNGGAQAPPDATLPPPPDTTGADAATAAPSPLDAQYDNDWEQAQFQANQQLGALRQTGDNDLTQRDALLGQLAVRQPVDVQNATNSANARGLLYSGALGSQVGDIGAAYQQQSADAINGFAQREAARETEGQGIQDGLPFEALALRLASIDRAAKAAQSASLTAPQLPAAAVPRAQGHSTQYTGPGQYATVGPASTSLRAVGHSSRYRGPGRYVKAGG